MSKAGCPGDHTDSPRGYFQWHEWAEEKGKTHEQRKCPHCGLWEVWVEKRPAMGLGAPTEDPGLGGII